MNLPIINIASTNFNESDVKNLRVSTGESQLSLTLANDKNQALLELYGDKESMKILAHEILNQINQYESEAHHACLSHTQY